VAPTCSSPRQRGRRGRAAGTLAIRAGGGPEDFTAPLPRRADVGQTITHRRESVAGPFVKAFNQIVVALTRGCHEGWFSLEGRRGPWCDPSGALRRAGCNNVMEVRGPNFLRGRLHTWLHIALQRQRPGHRARRRTELCCRCPLPAIVSECASRCARAPWGWGGGGGGGGASRHPRCLLSCVELAAAPYLRSAMRPGETHP